jgi:hypothetical protein
MMFGLTKREQRWAAEQKAAETLVPLAIAAIEARTTMDTNENVVTALNARLVQLEAELAKVRQERESYREMWKAEQREVKAWEAERDAAVAWKDKMISAYERGVEIGYDGRTGERDGTISLLLQAIRERSAARKEGE